MNKKHSRAAIWGSILLFGLLFVASVVFRDPEAGKKIDKSTAELTSLSPSLPPVKRWYSSEDAKLGESLYNKNCSECHGIKGVGPVGDWRKTLSDGSYPPPPLNGVAHTWHHSMKVLIRTIDEGGKRLGGKMPAFADKLSDEEVRLILAYIQSLWTDEIYTTWSRDVNKN